MALTLSLCAAVPAAWPAAPLAAQTSGSPREPAARGASPQDAGARALSLQVRPAPGDVLRLEMQQVIEMTGARKPAGVLAVGGLPTSGQPVDSAPTVGPRRDRLPTQVTIMDYYAHSTVESLDSTGIVLLAVTDSLLVRAGKQGQPLVSQSLPIEPSAGSTRVRVSTNGAMSMLNATGRAASVGATLSAMPAMLPDQPVAVGESWERDVHLPPLPFTSFRAEGVLRTTFTLDSTTRDGRDAYVSVRGELHRDGSLKELPVGSRVITDGTLRGTLVLDRKRGWITDARTTIEVRSDVVAADDAAPPMQLGIRISQRMRVR